MADQDNGLLAIEVDADDYAETAAGDTPAVDRTYQSEADFEAIKATYQAKHDGGNTYDDLISAVPALDSDKPGGSQCMNNGETKIKLSKKDFRLLGYAVGELYFDEEYGKILDLCERIRERCEVDARTSESLERWERRCRERLG